MLRRLQAASLRLLLVVGFGTLLAIMVALGAFAMRSADALGALTERLYSGPYAAGLAARELEIEMLRIHRAMKVAATADERVALDVAEREMAEAETAIVAGFAELRLRLPGEAALIDEAEQAHADWRGIRARLIEGRREGAFAGTVQIERESAAQVLTLRDLLRELRGFANAEAETFRNEAAAARSTAALRIFAFVLLGLAVGCAIGWLVVRAVRGPIEALSRTMTRLAGNELDVDVPFASARNEIGGMARAVLVFREQGLERERLKTESGREGERRLSRQQALEHAVGAFESRATKALATVDAAVAQLQDSAAGMARAAQETSLQSTTVTGAAREASANVQSVAAAGEELSATIADVGRQAHRSGEIAREAVRSAADTDIQVQELAAAAERIGSAVGLIDDLAARTNLLALNATIEAARAGEAGRGFAVVAAEVKQLAAQTTRATGEIGRTVDAIQSVTARAIDSIQSIGLTIAQIDRISGAIATAIAEQVRATGEIAGAVQQAARGTEEVSSSIGHVSEAARVTGHASAAVLTAAGDLAREAQVLRDDLDRFLTAVRAA